MTATNLPPLPPTKIEPQNLLPQERPGSTTSEFRVTLLSVVAGLAMIGLGLAFNKDSLTDNGTWIVLGSSGFYTVSRSLFKAKVGS